MSCRRQLTDTYYGHLMFGHAAYRVLSAHKGELGINHYGLTLRDDLVPEIDRINSEYNAAIRLMDGALA